MSDTQDLAAHERRFERAERARSRRHFRTRLVTYGLMAFLVGVAVWGGLTQIDWSHVKF